MILSVTGMPTLSADASLFKSTHRQYQVFKLLTRLFKETDFREAVKRFLPGDIHPPIQDVC